MELDWRVMATSRRCARVRRSCVAAGLPVAAMVLALGCDAGGAGGGAERLAGDGFRADVTRLPGVMAECAVGGAASTSGGR